MNEAKKTKRKNKSHNMYTSWMRNSPSPRSKPAYAYKWNGKRSLREALEKAKADLESKDE